MSDIYLELRSRIPIVASRTRLGSARIQEAQDVAGLSNEGIARQIPVSEKTWRRWKEAGEIPTAALPAVARVLNLELKNATAEKIEIATSRDADDQEITERLNSIEDTLGRILARFDEL